VILQLTYTVSHAQIKLGGYVAPLTGATNPTHIDSLGKGGYMVVPTISNRNEIPEERRKFGMLVFVQSADSLYKLNSPDLSNTGWLPIGFSSSSDVEKYLKYTKINDSTYDSLHVKANTIIDSNLEVKGRLILNTALEFQDSLVIQKGARVKKGLIVGDSLFVNRSVLIDSNLIVRGKAIVNDSLLAKSKALIGATLEIDSTSSAADSVQYAKNKEIDSANSVILVVGGGVRIDSSVYVNKDLEVKGNLILNTGLKFNDSLIVTKGARIDSSLILKGKLYLGDSLIAKDKALIGSTLKLDSTSTAADSIVYNSNKLIDSVNSVRLVVGGGIRVDSSVYIRGNFRLGGDLILDSGLFRSNFIVNLGEGVKFGRYNFKDTIKAKGLSIDQVFYDILTDITHPVYLQPSLKILYLDTIDASSTNKTLRYEIGDSLGVLQFSSNFIQNNAGERETTTYKQNGIIFSSHPDSTVRITALTDTLYYTSTILYDTGAVLTNRIGVLDSTGIILKGTIVSDTISIFPIAKNYWGYSLYADSTNISDSLMLGIDSTSGKGFSDFANSASKTSFTIPITGGENYIYYAYPAFYPDLTSIMVGPFESIDAFAKIIRNVVNAQGYSQAYKIYVSINNFSDKVEKIVIN
jgi:NDP-sugar pyrophosphorylase family protein